MNDFPFAVFQKFVSRFNPVILVDNLIFACETSRAVQGESVKVIDNDYVLN